MIAISEAPPWKLFCALWGVVYLQLAIITVSKIGVTTAVIQFLMLPIQ